MKKIRCKADIERLIEEFHNYADYDGTKHYLALDNGSITIMRYDDDRLTMYRKFETFWDIREMEIKPGDLWKYRKALNMAIK